MNPPSQPSFQPTPRGGWVWLLLPDPLFTLIHISCCSLDHSKTPPYPCSELPSPQDQGGSILAPTSTPGVPQPHLTRTSMKSDCSTWRAKAAQPALPSNKSETMQKPAVPSLRPFSEVKVLWLPEGRQTNRGFSWLPVPTSQVHSQSESPAPFLTTPMASLFKRQKEKIKNFRMG